MKEDIHLIGNAFKHEASEYQKTEKTLREIMELKAKYDLALQKRAEALNKIRLEKIQEINDELEKANLELKNLHKNKEIDEKTKLINYINYLHLLKKKICELFGHDMEECIAYPHFRDSGHLFECKCCGKLMSVNKYIYDHRAAKHRGVVAYYFDDDSYNKSPEDTNFSLPTFESYLESIQEKTDGHRLAKKRIDVVSDYNSRAGSLKL